MAHDQKETFNSNTKTYSIEPEMRPLIKFKITNVIIHVISYNGVKRNLKVFISRFVLQIELEILKFS